MKNKGFIQGVEILARYIPSNEINKNGVSSSDDQIFFCAEEWVTDPIDRARLEDLGWVVDKGAWSCFTYC